MRVAFLWTELSGYTNACLKALAGRHGAELFVASMQFSPEAPFEETQFDWLHHRFHYGARPDPAALAAAVKAFRPDLLLFCSWHIPGFRAVAREWAGVIPRVMAMDNQWRSTPKQWLGRALRSIAITPIADFAFVAGERQADFARRLGFAQDRILYGVYAADVDRFAQPPRGPRQSFLYIGRLLPMKGVAALANAYARYRERAGPAAWPLVVCGTGPERDLLAGRPGVELRGFVQPSDLPAIMAEAGCYVMPSLTDPWGVAIHEATAAGLPVICTTACGASTHLVQDGYNGMLVAPGRVDQLTDAMHRFAALAPDARAQMAAASRELSRQFTPARWADTVHGVLHRLPASRDR